MSDTISAAAIQARIDQLQTARHEHVVQMHRLDGAISALTGLLEPVVDVPAPQDTA